MTGLFGKITDQMIVNCKDCITGKDTMDALWEKVSQKGLTEKLPIRGTFGVEIVVNGTTECPIQIPSLSKAPCYLSVFTISLRRFAFCGLCCRSSIQVDCLQGIGISCFILTSETLFCRRSSFGRIPKNWFGSSSPVSS